jgi:F420-0:gamma-glutamyl ligase
LVFTFLFCSRSDSTIKGGDPSGARLDISEDYIAGWLPNGIRLTSAGVDKIDSEHVMLLPENADASAREIGKTILEIISRRVGIIITDSDGRVEKKGSTQVAIGIYGIPALRTSESVNQETGETKMVEETLCDLLAAAAALVMGQRGTNKPVVKISGVEYEFNEDSRITDALAKVPDGYVDKY